MSTVIAAMPLTNEELSKTDEPLPLRYPASEAEYWSVAQEAEYRADYYRGEIIASMSYESEDHAAIASRLNFYLQQIFFDFKAYRIGNSNRPVCIPTCGNAIFNPDGSVIQLPARFYEYQKGMRADLTPIVVFEVLSPSTRVRDLGEKLPCYKQIEGIEHILYVDGATVKVHHMQRQGDNQWLETVYTEREEHFEINGKPIKIGDLYAGVDFEKPEDQSGK
ncbi:Uma2 family endonuclease [Phaeodactylibacter sp.]|jgi:Uma2 family endonuclease|uniref:Uma2 family endonuclease n=1 Tax=Phaeodactylibacter sp. TaxID=1940289 RepID=UPI0025D14CCA|nr:Uma2 family endonuclease [Phaeodactylibacter sp.]MCI4646872.1 Uma2 family endonuclease [Phaeodactylibacter sp.]MCI5091679.1 Uma2 family endonuclease [Phaeodactylibacter sp.]